MSPAPYVDAVLADSPTGYWRLEEATGTLATDSSGNGLNGTYVGTVTRGINGPMVAPSKAISIGGTGANANLINLGNPAALQIRGNQTIEMWIQTNSLNARRNPWYKAYGAEGAMTLETNGAINYFYGTSSGDASPYIGHSTPAGAITVGPWYHIVHVRNVTTMRLHWYINAVEVSNIAAAYALSGLSAANTWIGEGYVEAWHGAIDEFAIYNKALTAERVKAHYDASFIPPGITRWTDYGSKSAMVMG